MRPREPSKLIQLVALPLLYFVGVKVSLAFSVTSESVVILWLPNGLLLAALLHCHLRRFFSFAALIVVAEIAADYPTYSLLEAVLFGVINLAEATLAYSLLRRWRFDPGLARPVDLAKFLLAGPGIAALLAAGAATLMYSYFRGIELSVLQFMRVWWFSDGTGIMIVTPLVLSLWPIESGLRDDPIRLQWFDLAVAVMGAFVLGAFLLAENGQVAGMQIRPVHVLPFVVYAGARFTPRVTSLVLVIFVAAVLYSVGNGQPFGEMPLRETVVLGQQVILIMTIMSLGLAALLAQLRGNERHLEARVLARTQELSVANEQLLQLAQVDSLTGAVNRRVLFEELQREMDRHRRNGRALAVIMFDLDRFKDVNDRLGHAAGDRVLQCAARTIARTMRRTDTLARYGGEEFVLIAPETDTAQATALAERLRSALREHPIDIDGVQVTITASFGVSLLSSEDAEPENVLRRADLALYEAKAAGRDRVVARIPTLADGNPPPHSHFALRNR